MARPKRFELLTPRFVVWCSIQLSYGRLCASRRRTPCEALFQRTPIRLVNWIFEIVNRGFIVVHADLRAEGVEGSRPPGARGLRRVGPDFDHHGRARNRQGAGHLHRRERQRPAAEAAFPDLVDRIEFVEVGVELQHANDVMQ